MMTSGAHAGAADHVASLQVVASELTLVLGDGSRARFNRYWLRDNCPSAGERASLFRSFSVADLAEDLSLAAASLNGDAVAIQFSDGTADAFAVDWLLEQHRQLATQPTVSEPWRTGHDLERVTFDALTRGTEAHLQFLELVARSGAVVVTGLPDDTSTEVLATLLGPIRETDFGRVFDIITEPDAFTPSQTDHQLDPHTDDPYRYSPAGISILHCVIPSAGGGESTIVDGFAIAQDIRSSAPEQFEALSTVPVEFAHRRAEAVDQGDDVHLLASAPVITVDGSGDVSGIRFHERAMNVLSIDADVAERFYPALRRFARDVRGEDYLWRRGLQAGEALVYDNQRVLHGRDAFDGSVSRRHMRLCTTDRDQVHSRLRRLREQHGTGTQLQHLPAGNLS